MSNNKYIDVHLHLTDDRYADCTDAVIAQARQAGVEYMLCNSAVENDWGKVINLTRLHNHVVPYLGIHPWFVEDLSEGWESRLIETADNIKCGIGETGLDRLLTKADFKLQCQVLTKQIDIAFELNRPITIHCLKAYGKLLEITGKYGRMPKGSFIHSYSGSPEMIPQFALLGLMFSYNGKALDDNNEKYIESIKATPLENILLETDSPFMLPKKMSDFGENIDNVPSNLPVFAQKIAEIKDVSLEKLNLAAYQNALGIIAEIRK